MGEGAYRLTNLNQTLNTGDRITGVRPRGINFAVKRETAQTNGYGPGDMVKCKRMWRYKDSRDVGLEAATI